MNLYDFIPGRLSRIAVGQSDLNLSRDPRDGQNQILSRARDKTHVPGLVTNWLVSQYDSYKRRDRDSFPPTLMLPGPRWRRGAKHTVWHQLQATILPTV